MWIKLIAPRATRRPMDSEWKVRMAPPLGLLVVGALTPAAHRVTLEDENVSRLTVHDRPDVVGISVKVDTAPRAFAIAGLYRRRGVPVVLGGIHPTACPGDCQPHADAIVVGEAEGLWPALLADLATGRRQGIYRHHGRVDPAQTPIPRWDLLDQRHYLFTNTMCIGRGCPWRCDFCYNSSPNIDAGYRIKPLPRLLAEIDSLGIDHVMFIDDNFIGDPQAVRRLLPELKARGLTWHAAVSADIARHPALLDLMAGCGCRSLFIGFETVNQASLLRCRKTQNRTEQYDATIGAIHGRGIMVNASVVFGFDEDDESVFPSTLHWLVRNRVASMTAHILTPYPGTKLHARLEAEGRILDRDLSHYNTAHAVFQPRRMSPRALEEGYRRIYDCFYSGSCILERLPPDPRQRIAYLEFNLLYRKYGWLTSRLGRWFGMRPLANLARHLAYPRRHRDPEGQVPRRAAASSPLPPDLAASIPADLVAS